MLGILGLSIGVAILATVLLIAMGAPLVAVLFCYAGIGAAALLIAAYWKARSNGWTPPDATPSADPAHDSGPKT